MFPCLGEAWEGSGDRISVGSSRSDELKISLKVSAMDCCRKSEEKRKNKKRTGSPSHRGQLIGGNWFTRGDFGSRCICTLEGRESAMLSDGGESYRAIFRNGGGE